MRIQCNISIFSFNNVHKLETEMAFITATMDTICFTIVLVGMRRHWSTGSQSVWVSWDGMASVVDVRCSVANKLCKIFFVLSLTCKQFHFISACTWPLCRWYLLCHMTVLCRDMATTTLTRYDCGLPKLLPVLISSFVSYAEICPNSQHIRCLNSFFAVCDVFGFDVVCVKHHLVSCISVKRFV